MAGQAQEEQKEQKQEQEQDKGVEKALVAEHAAALAALQAQVKAATEAKLRAEEEQKAAEDRAKVECLAAEKEKAEIRQQLQEVEAKSSEAVKDLQAEIEEITQELTAAQKENSPKAEANSPKAEEKAEEKAEAVLASELGGLFPKNNQLVGDLVRLAKHYFSTEEESVKNLQAITYEDDDFFKVSSAYVTSVREAFKRYSIRINVSDNNLDVEPAPIAAVENASPEKGIAKIVLLCIGGTFGMVAFITPTLLGGILATTFLAAPVLPMAVLGVIAGVLATFVLIGLGMVIKAAYQGVRSQASNLSNFFSSSAGDHGVAGQGQGPLYGSAI